MQKHIKLFCFLAISLFLQSPVFSQWTTLPGKVSAMWYNCGTAYDGRVYFTGGAASAAVTTAAYDRKVYFLDLATNTIGTLPGGLSAGRMSIMCVAYAGKLYFVGGHKWIAGPGYLKSQFFSNMDIYDIASGTWDYSHSLSQARGFAAATIVDGKIMFAGGYKAVNGVEQPSDLVEIWNPATQSFEPTQQLSQARGWIGATTIGNQAWFCGGETNYLNATPSSRVDIYKNGKWETKELSQARSSAAAVAVGNFVLVAGGGVFTPNQAITTNRVDRFDTLTNTQYSAHVLSSARFGIGTAVVGKKAYFTGGGGINTAGTYFNSSTTKVDVFDADKMTFSLSPYAMREARTFHTCAAWGNKIAVGGGWHPEADPTYGTTGSVEVLTDNSVAVDNPAATAIAFTLSPNPVGDELRITLAENTAKQAFHTLVVSDISGKTILYKKLANGALQNSLKLDVSAFSTGVYFLTLYSESALAVSRKFIVMPR